MGPRKYGRNLFFQHFGGRSHYIVHDFSNCLTAKPAPRTTRPLAGLPNPYPYGCSVLCNHPRDPELKDVVWRPRMSSVTLTLQLLEAICIMVAFYKNNYTCFRWLFAENRMVVQNTSTILRPSKELVGRVQQLMEELLFITPVGTKR